MPDQVPTITPRPQAEAAPGDTMRPPGPGASESRRAEEQGRVGTPLDGAPRKWPRRRIARWVANLMIIGGVCLLTYPLGTWGYTWYEQRHLRQELVQSNPGLAAAEAALAAGDLIRATPPSTTTAQAPDPQTGAPGTPTTPTTIDPAETERLAQLAAFKAAADAFAEKVGWKRGAPLGRMVIPSIGLDVVMVEGTSNADLKAGPGHWPETPFPGQGGNFVVSGHRTTYGHPFFYLNKVKVGDEIDLILPYGVARYVVSRTLIVYPDEVTTVAQAGKEQVSLAACHPIYSAKERLVVQGDLVAFKPVGQ